MMYKTNIVLLCRHLGCHTFALVDTTRLEGPTFPFRRRLLRPSTSAVSASPPEGPSPPLLRTPAKRGWGQGRLASLCVSSLDRRSKAESRRHCVLYFDYINCDEERFVETTRSNQSQAMKILHSSPSKTFIIVKIEDNH